MSMLNRLNSLNRLQVACAILLTTLIKLWITLTTLGTNDVTSWQKFADSVTDHGALWLYHHDVLFNHPPFMTRALFVLDWLAHHTPLGFPFWIRIPGILADCGSLYLIALLIKPNARLLLLAIFCPISILVSGFHGNTDPIMMFLILLSIYFLQERKWLVASAAVFALAACIKIVALVLAPAFVFYLVSNRQRIVFASVACGCFVLLCLPYLFQDPVIITRNVFRYRSSLGVWGFNHLAHALDVMKHRAVGDPGNYIYKFSKVEQIAIFVLVTGLMMLLSRRRISLYTRCAVSFFVLVWLIPGFGVQYLDWLAPFALSFGEAWAIAVYCSSGLFMFLVYNYWSLSFPWYYANSMIVGMWPHWVVAFEFLAWFIIGLTVFVYLRRLWRINPVMGAAAGQTDLRAAQFSCGPFVTPPKTAS
jgi:Gpi18-like mannosyltransferase